MCIYSRNRDKELYYYIAADFEVTIKIIIVFCVEFYIWKCDKKLDNFDAMDISIYMIY